MRIAYKTPKAPQPTSSDNSENAHKIKLPCLSLRRKMSNSRSSVTDLETWLQLVAERGKNVLVELQSGRYYTRK